MVCLGRPYHFKYFIGCLPQILLGPFLNTLTHINFCPNINIRPNPTPDHLWVENESQKHSD